jgi:hypothetical protein
MNEDRKVSLERAEVFPHPKLQATVMPELTAADVQVVLNDLKPSESASKRLSEAAEWAPILGPLYSKSRLLCAKRAADRKSKQV